MFINQLCVGTRSDGSLEDMRNPLPPPSPTSGRGSARRTSRSFVFPAAGALALILAVGCHRDEVAHYRVPKDAGAQAPGMAAPPMGMPGADVPEPPKPSDQGTLKWTLPKGWTEEQAGGMRFATLKPPVTGKIDASVVVLPGTAGGELANVNRWRGQIGLPPIDESTLATQRTTLKTKAGNLSVFDFTSEGKIKSRMVAGLITTADGNTWFLKLTGDAGPVGSAKSDFMRLMGSIRLD